MVWRPRRFERRGNRRTHRSRDRASDHGKIREARDDRECGWVSRSLRLAVAGRIAEAQGPGPAGCARIAGRFGAATRQDAWIADGKLGTRRAVEARLLRSLA